MTNVDKILKGYPYIAEDIKSIQTKLNKYIQLQQEARNTLKGQALDRMPHGSGISDQTYDAVEKIIDMYQVEINKCVADINKKLDLKNKLDMAMAELTEDERRILYLKYDERWQAWKIMRRMGILHRDTFYRRLDSAKNKISKVIS